MTDKFIDEISQPVAMDNIYNFILESGEVKNMKHMKEIKGVYRLCDEYCEYNTYECYCEHEDKKYICFIRELESNLDEPVVLLHHFPFETPTKWADLSGNDGQLCAFNMRKGVKRVNNETKYKFDYDEVYMVVKDGEIIFDYEAEAAKSAAIRKKIYNK